MLIRSIRFAVTLLIVGLSAVGVQSASAQSTTADVVYGQLGSFTTGNYNNGGISADTLFQPDGVALDSVGNLYVADTYNSRVLFYPAGSTTATRVYGQGGSFISNTRNNGGISANSLFYPRGVALDSSGNLYVADHGNSRVLFYPSGSTTATRVYGQLGSFTSDTPNDFGISADSLYNPWAVALDSSGNLYVADYDNNRVLFYPAGSTTATRVYGQGGSFTTNAANNGGINANSLWGPAGGVALDSSGNLYVADYGNSRVLFYPAGSTTATRVYGQFGSFTTNTANNGGISANSLNDPLGVTLDSSGNLYVADIFNSRVLVYPSSSTTATLVYGQGGSFTSGNANKGGTSANSLYYPAGVALDSNSNFYVADYANNRVLAYPPTSDYVLTVSTSGSGTVDSTDGFINCPGTCSHLYPSNTPVTLNATPASGWTFTGWSGACSGTGPCNVSMTQDLSVTANFSQQDYLLTVSTGNGSGTVTSMDGGINCPGTCGDSYRVNTQVTLDAMAAPGWSFAGWSGACTGTGPCTVTMTQDQPVTATFTLLPNNYTLTVSISGSGTVTSSPGGINCPGTCSYTYPRNTPVTLNAMMPGQNGTFSGWSGGGCSGTGSCIVTMTQNLSVTATFTGESDMVMHTFGTGKDGQTPTANLISDSHGNLYGTTSAGGVYGEGTIFELLPNGSETVLYNFSPPNSNDGQKPLGNLILDSVGNLYGTTSAGGAYGNGTVFELSPNGTETLLYNFGNGGDGQKPSAGLIFDSPGNLYGTTANGGANGGGTAFELSPNGAGGWTEGFLYSFGTVGNDGLNPNSGLVVDSSGNLYGTTVNGGANGGGTVFELLFNALNGRCCREIMVYSFGSGSDGRNPYAGLVFDSSGNLYGTTAFGGANNNSGTAFALSSSGGGWTETFLYNFGSGSDGQNPYAGLIFDSSGNLYGTTASGGLYSGGTVFELLPSISANNRCCREMPIYSFGSGSDARNPHAGLVVDSSGNLHGTTVNGGVNDSGTVFGISPLPSPVQFAALTPCRVVDTRNPNGPFGGPPIGGHSSRSFPLAQSGNPCGIPASAVAYSLNVTVVPGPSLGYLTIWPAGEGQPVVSTMNSPDGRVKANAAIIPAGTPTGSVSVYVTDTTNVILDIDGYFTPSTGSTLEFYPLTPCRVVDTRHANGDLGGPYLTHGQPRNFPVLESTCGISNSAQAYSFNFTAIPRTRSLGFLSVWPEGQTQPLVSTLNDTKGTIVANAAIVPGGSGGGITVFATDDTDLAIDVNGYFAPVGTGGLSLYVLTPCRVLDTRHEGGAFTGKLVIDVLNSVCAPPSSAQAYVFNATVVPQGSLGYLALWPDGQPQPVVSTLNAPDGSITSNMAIVPASTQGKIDAFAANGITNLLMDISSYFAP